MESPQHKSPTLQDRAKSLQDTLFHTTEDLYKRVTGAHTKIDQEIIEEYRWDPSRLSRVVMVCVEGSSYSREAFDWICKEILEDGRLQQEEGTLGILLVHIRSRDWLPGVADVSAVVRSDRQEKVSQSQRLVREYVKMVKEKDVPCKGVVVIGDARSELVKTVEEYDPDILVLGRRGVTRVEKFVSASVSEHCLNHVKSCPVIIVRQRKKMRKQ